MRKTFFLMLALIACLGANAQDKKIALKQATASSAQAGNEAAKAIDGNPSTLWHSTWSSATQFPVTLTITLEEATHVDYVRYIPRQDGNPNGNWRDVYVAYCPTTTGTNFVSIGKYSLQGTSAQSDIWLTEKGTTCGQIRFTIESGSSNFASAAEIEAYAVDNSYTEQFAQYFTDAIFSELKPEVTSSEGIEDATLKALVDNLLNDANAYRKFRVGEYEPYMTTATVQRNLKTNSQYNNYENPTGIYLKPGESCFVAVSGIGNYPVGLKIKDWYKSGDLSSYSLRNGLNYITAITEGNVFVNYYTDDFEQAPNVQMHFINAPVLGYWDQKTMTNADWESMLAGPLTKDDEVIIITRSEHAQTAYPVKQWKTYCPANVNETMTNYQNVQWAERDILGLEKYGRQVKNRQLFYADKSGSMYAGGDASVCGYGDLRVLVTPDAKVFDFWGVGHEWGHNNQMPGFHWSGCGETTNNIPASWAQIHFTGNRDSQGKVTNLRLEDENTGVNDYSGMRGGRMQTYFEEGLRKGVAWQLQNGPDYHGATPETKTVAGYDADGKYIGMVTTTSRNYDHFVKLVPFWQLNLWGTLAGKCPDIIPMVIESIRTTPDYGATYNTNGKQQINWMKLACDSAKIDLLPFFEKAGMLRPINAYIEDYGAGWNIINEKMINELKDYVKEQGYPAFTEEINYINGHNYHIYRDNLKLEVPEKLGSGCAYSNNKVTVQHNIVKNAVAFETYNVLGELMRITMYGLGSNDEHSFTQVLFPKNGEGLSEIPSYIMAVGYDGTRVKVFEEAQDVNAILLKYLRTSLSNAKECIKKIDDTNTKIGWFIPKYTTDLQACVKEVDEVVANKDQSEHTYGEWKSLLDSTMNALLENKDARIPISENCFYSIVASNDETLMIEYTSSGLKSSLMSASDYTSQWKFVPAEAEDTYYIQHRTTGNYISVANNNAQVKAKATTTAEAISFVFVPGEVGEFLIQRADNNSINLYSSEKKKNQIIAGGLTENNSTGSALWTITLMDDLNKLPETSNGSERITYYIQDVQSGENLCQYTGIGRNGGRLTKGTPESMDDNNYLFYFQAGAEKGKYIIYNCATEKTVTIDSKNNLMVNKDTEAPVEYSITVAEDGNGFIISYSGKHWATSGYVTLNSTNQSVYKFQEVGKTTNVENITVGELDSDIYFDLTGRRVDNPTTGIYIHNGKKILVK